MRCAGFGMTADLSLDISDRLIYADFPFNLKAALRQAARRWRWDREAWRYQTLLIQDALCTGRCTAEELTAQYQQTVAADEINTDF